jgi:hypothetical protein
MQDRRRDCCEASIDYRLGPPNTLFTSSEPSGGRISLPYYLLVFNQLAAFADIHAGPSLPTFINWCGLGHQAPDLRTRLGH